MLQLDKLRALCNSEHSGVTSVKKQIHLALEPSFLSNINFGILKCLNSHLQEYYPEVSGILLGYDDVKLKKSTGAMYSDQPHIHIDIQAIFYIFCPSPGKFLLGTVNKKSDGHVGVLVHDTFNGSILKTAETPMKSWAGSKLVVGKVVKFKVLSVSYSMNRLVLLGELDRETMGVGEREVMVGIIEQVSDFEGESEHDSGIENGTKRKSKEAPATTTVQVNGEASGASSSKRKAEEEAEDEGERKKRKKAEKKARKEKEREESEKSTLESFNTVDSSEEFQSDSKLKKKKKDKENKSEDSNFSNILESDLQAPKTPKPKEKSSLLVPKTPKTPKDNYVLPSDFKVVEHKTEKSSWKSYQGPDGKMFRSLTDVKKFVESTTSNFDSKNLAATIEFVATEWNTTDTGHLASDKNKFYKSEVVKEFPKTELYFVDMKPKPKKTISDSSKVQAASTSDTTDNNISQDEETEVPSKLEDVGDKMKKKKKKKKNKSKSKDSSLE